MNVDELAIKNNFLEEENKKLQEELQKTKDELEKTKEHLKKYTAPANNKIYYEKNKEAHKQRVKEYKEKTNYSATLSSEKKKEYARQAYINKKKKLKKIEEEKNENI
jgi:hypothetical protein